MVFLYDVNGFIAGMQSPVPVANTDNQYFDYDASAAYSKDTIAGVEVHPLIRDHSYMTQIKKNWPPILLCHAIIVAFCWVWVRTLYLRLIRAVNTFRAVNSLLLQYEILEKLATWMLTLESRRFPLLG